MPMFSACRCLTGETHVRRSPEKPVRFKGPLGVAVGAVTHAAYHAGAIRQRLPTRGG